MNLDLDRIYEYRFDGIPPKVKVATWRKIANWILRDAQALRGGRAIGSILDPACGDGEFLNACDRHQLRLTGCDLRERSTLLTAKANFFHGMFQEMDLDEKFDLVWISNLLEHLQSPEEVQDFLWHCRQRLSPDGLLFIMGPNIKFCGSEYWDFADHKLPLSHLTVMEHLASANFRLLSINDRFLPYSFRSRLPIHPSFVELYLNNPWSWPVLGKQFLIRASLP